MPSSSDQRFVAPITVMVVEESRTGFGAVWQALHGNERVSVVERTTDAANGLARAAKLKPTFLILDLDTPKFDAKTFLRLLLATSPMPVVAVSSSVDDSLRAAICGAGAAEVLFKPPVLDASSLAMFRDVLLAKLDELQWVAQNGGPRIPGKPAARVVAIGASTGGPAAVQAFLEAMNGQSACFLIAQHMPARSTKSFAERLSRGSALPVYEAKDGDRLHQGHALVAPGGQHLVLRARGGYLEVETVEAAPGEAYAPSVDRLFESVAQALGPLAFGIILTGMGSDGAQGALAISRAGGEVWAEGEHSAAIFGMPKEAIATGAVRRILPLPQLVPALISELQRPIP